MYNVMIRINTAVCYMKVLRVNPKNSHHKEHTFSCFFNSVSIFEDECLTELIVIISTMYQVTFMLYTFKLIRACVSYVSIKLKH